MTRTRRDILRAAVPAVAGLAAATVATHAAMAMEDDAELFRLVREFDAAQATMRAAWPAHDAVEAKFFRARRLGNENVYVAELAASEELAREHYRATDRAAESVMYGCRAKTVAGLRAKVAMYLEWEAEVDDEGESERFLRALAVNMDDILGVAA